MQYGYHDQKDKLTKRLRRAEGQVRGVAQMVQDDKYCIDVLTQINAAQAALDKVALELLRDHAKHCLSNDKLSAPEREAKAEELISAVNRFLSR